MSTTRRLAAILAADVAGYLRLMAVEDWDVESLTACRREVANPEIATVES